MREDFYAEYFRIEDRHWWFVGRRRILLTVLDRYLGPADGERRILDLGCGTGTMLSYLERYGRAEGVDADAQAVQFSHRRGARNVSLLTSDDLPFEDRTFDLVTALDVLEHVEDDVRTLREIARVLRPTGTLLTTVPAYRWMWGAQDEISRHFRRYTAGQLRERILASGYSIERLTYFNTLLFPPIAAVRVARRGLRSSEEGDVRSDFEMTKEGAVNRLLASVFGFEARWLRAHDFPFGVSLLAVVRGPST